MIDRVLYCDGPGKDGNPCGREVAGHGEDKCSTHLKQLQRTGKCTVIAEKVSPQENLINIYARYAEADSDQEEQAAKRAFWTQAAAILKVTPDDQTVAETVKKWLSEATRRGIAAAKSRGERGPGRPPVAVDPAEFDRLSHLGPDTLALVFRVSRATVYRILKKGVFETTGSPRPARESP